MGTALCFDPMRSVRRADSANDSRFACLASELQPPSAPKIFANVKDVKDVDGRLGKLVNSQECC